MSIAMNSIFPSTVWNNQRFLSVSAAFVESEIHHRMTEAKTVAVAHLEVAVSTVGGVGAMWKVGMPAM